MNAQKFEHLLHRILTDAKLDLSIADKTQHNYEPREWFIVPLDVVDQIIELIINGGIVNFEYDPETQSLQEV
jgi:hypothetical protein